MGDTQARWVVGIISRCVYMKRDSKFTYRRGAVLGDREGQLNLGSEIYLWGIRKQDGDTLWSESVHGMGKCPLQSHI